jgi:hypothetical protein
MDILTSPDSFILAHSIAALTRIHLSDFRCPSLLLCVRCACNETLRLHCLLQSVSSCPLRNEDSVYVRCDSHSSRLKNNHHSVLERLQQLFELYRCSCWPHSRTETQGSPLQIVFAICENLRLIESVLCRMLMSRTTVRSWCSYSFIHVIGTLRSTLTHRCNPPRSVRTVAI